MHSFYPHWKRWLKSRQVTCMSKAPQPGWRIWGELETRGLDMEGYGYFRWILVFAALWTLAETV